jgi:hypothetical protein
MAATMSATIMTARVVAPAGSGKKLQARSSAFAAAGPKTAARRASASAARARGAVRVVAEVEEPLVKIGTRGR